MSLPNSKDTGPDGVSVRLLKTDRTFSVSALDKVVQLVHGKRLFPKQMENCACYSLHKDGPRDCKDNYRPVLSVLSKLLEKHVAHAYMDYLVQNGLIYHLQSAFHKAHSTEMALINLRDQILHSLD